MRRRDSKDQFEIYCRQAYYRENPEKRLNSIEFLLKDEGKCQRKQLRRDISKGI